MIYSDENLTSLSIFKRLSAKFSLIRAAGIWSKEPMDNSLRVRPQESKRASKSLSLNPSIIPSVFKFGREQIISIVSSLMRYPHLLSSKCSKLLELAIAWRIFDTLVSEICSDLSVEEQAFRTDKKSCGKDF